MKGAIDMAGHGRAESSKNRDDAAPKTGLAIRRGVGVGNGFEDGGPPLAGRDFRPCHQKRWRTLFGAGARGKGRAASDAGPGRLFAKGFPEHRLSRSET